MSDVPPPGCTLLEFDSAHFGLRIARVAAGPLGAGEAVAAAAGADAGAIDCLYYLAEAADLASIHAAEAGGFRLADVRLTLGRPLEAAPACPADVAPWRSDDLEALVAIARVSHRDTRFYADAGFPRDRADALYELWIRKSCTTAWADEVLVAREGDRPLGYVACHLDPGGAGRIGLLAVAEAARGRGLGRALNAAALAWFAGQGCARATVVTQGRNTAALRAYERAGFTVEQVQLWLHRWRPSRRSGGGPSAASEVR